MLASCSKHERRSVSAGGPGSGEGRRHLQETTHVIVKLLMSVTYKDLLEAVKRIAAAAAG